MNWLKESASSFGGVPGIPRPLRQPAPNASTKKHLIWWAVVLAVIAVIIVVIVVIARAAREKYSHPTKYDALVDDQDDEYATYCEFRDECLAVTGRTITLSDGRPGVCMMGGMACPLPMQISR